MGIKKRFFACILAVIVHFSLAAQTHIAVPLGNPVYHVIEQARMRGLCANLPYTKPYSRTKILSIIEEIIDNDETRRFGGLTDAERGVLEQFRQTFGPNKMGLDLARGAYSTEHLWNDIYFSGELGVDMDFSFAGGLYPLAGGYRYDAADDPLFEGASHPESGDFFTALDLGVMTLSFKGDLGRNASYGFSIRGGVYKSPRAVLGQQHPYYKGFDDPADPDGPNKPYTVRSEPLAYFPFTYKKHWDSFVFAPDGVSSSGMLIWPDDVSLGYSMIPELAGELLNGHVLYRFARLDREWAGMTNNGSLLLNQSAEPFLAFETTIVPFDWIMFSGLTGVLEYHNAIGQTNNAELKEDSESFQNAFSIVMLELNYKNYFHFDIGSSVVWPKRFELGYLFPFADKYTYQNNIGDFDNAALFLDLQGQYPGLGKLWFSLLLDEVNLGEENFAKNFLELDRMMYAFQVGGSAYIPWLPFSSVTLSYTKVEPYVYTHPRIQVPWYGDRLMETNYVSFGKSLGHYIPPNSDEILVRFECLPTPQSMVSLQYQMIRHGADYGDRAVDGSSLWSELDPDNRSENPVLRKYFLRDGAYQWMHILRLKGEYSFGKFKLPVKLYAEMGGVYSYFTDIDSSIEPNSGSPNPYKIINTPQYPHTLSLIGMIGIQIFPDF